LCLFFQAEDGIRDFHVTGVQTCALPISTLRGGPMRHTTYSKYTSSILDALNIQDLLERLADFLLQSGFEGGPHYHPWWGWSGEYGEDRSHEALKGSLRQELIERGQLTLEMLAELRGEGEGDEATRREIAELLVEMVRRLVEE